MVNASTHIEPAGQETQLPLSRYSPSTQVAAERYPDKPELHEHENLKIKGLLNETIFRTENLISEEGVSSVINEVLEYIM